MTRANENGSKEFARSDINAVLFRVKLLCVDYKIEIRAKYDWKISCVIKLFRVSFKMSRFKKTFLI